MKAAAQPSSEPRPALIPAIDELVALRAAAHGIDFHAHRPALARLHGGHRSAQRGRGLEFEEVRLYAPGDDARSIDWRVTARRGRPHTKLFREERERPVWILADLHEGLFFGSRRQIKSALLLRAAAVLGWAAVLSGDRLGAVISAPRGNGMQNGAGAVNGGDAPRILPPKGRQMGVLPILETLVEMQPRRPAQTAGVTAQLSELLSAARAIVQPGSLVLLMSDYSGLDAVAEHALAGICRHADCRMLWIRDPLEATGLPDGRYRGGIPGRIRWLDGGRTRNPWQAAWAARTARVRAVADGLQLPLIALDTTDDPAVTVPALLREPRWAV